MKTIYHDPITGITVKKGNDWPVRVILCLLIIATGLICWNIDRPKEVVETLAVAEPVVKEPLPVEIKPSQTSTTELHSNPQQMVRNEPKVEVNVYNAVRGGDTTVFTKLEQLKEQFATNLSQQTGASGMTFEEYDQKIALLATGTNLNNPADFRQAIGEMARISTEYWGFVVNPTTDDVFDRWHDGIQMYKQSHPEFESAIVTQGKSAFTSIFDKR